MATNSERLLLRAREPVARCLIRKLIVPKVFFDARWPDEESRTDLLVIDRAGAGDVHVVEIKSNFRAARSAIPGLLDVPANYRWLAVPRAKNLEEAVSMHIDELYPPKGAGRVGIIEIVEIVHDLGASVVLQAERFPERLADPVDEFVATHAADIEYRPQRVRR